MHGLGIAAAIAGMVFGALLPFVPGRYESLAVPLSTMCRVFGWVGPLLVPVGVLWIASGYVRRPAGGQFGIAIAALVASSVVGACVAVGALVSGGILFGVGVLALEVYAGARMLRSLTRLRLTPPPSTSPVAFYLLFVPLGATLIQLATVAPAVERSRSLAIRNSALLIADIERYRAANGRYPASLLSVSEDYLPGLLGISEYQYEPSEEAYNLVFEQPALEFGTKEFVVYNPLGRQTFTSHQNDLLRLTPDELALEHTRGHYAVRDAAEPHWKSFWFD